MHFRGTFLLLLFLTIQVQAESPLKTVIGENMSAPWYISSPQGEAQGITADYIRALAKELDRTIEIQVLPKFRIKESFAKRKTDLNCYTSREWAHVSENDVHWSEPLFSSKNLIASNKSPPKSLDELKDQRIGTVLKYNYPSLQSRFSSGELIRDDSSNEEANLQKLEGSRFNYAVVEEVHLTYYLKNHKSSKIHKQGLVTEEVPVRCWVRKDAPLKIADLNRAIAEIKSNGTLEKIFRKYK